MQEYFSISAGSSYTFPFQNWCHSFWTVSNNPKAEDPSLIYLAWTICFPYESDFWVNALKRIIIFSSTLSLDLSQLDAFKYLFLSLLASPSCWSCLRMLPTSMAPLRNHLIDGLGWGLEAGGGQIVSSWDKGDTTHIHAWVSFPSHVAVNSAFESQVLKEREKKEKKRKRKEKKCSCWRTAEKGAGVVALSFETCTRVCDTHTHTHTHTHTRTKG